MCLPDFTRDLFEEVAWKRCAVEGIKYILRGGGREREGEGKKRRDTEVLYLGFICPLTN